MLSISIVKQPSFSVLAAENRASREFYFRFRSPKGAFHVTPKRGSRAPQSAESPCPCKEHGTDPAGPASPYGAPLRRLKSLGPRFPCPEAFRLRGGCKERALGVYFTPGGLSKDSRDHGVRKPWAQAPLPHHIWLACADAPLSEGGCAQSSRLQTVVKVKVFL
jgi:hypothetical protein